MTLAAHASRIPIVPPSSIGVAGAIEMSKSSNDRATAMAKFSLHERLRADTIELTRWPLSIVLLMNVRHWPWLVLVPRRPEIREIHELQETDQRALTAEIVRASRTLTELVRPHKINVAALGNVVPQLHVHCDRTVHRRSRLAEGRLGHRAAGALSRRRTSTEGKELPEGSR
jgi:diadenosine tetraphosphate (Ap4A) HIT family hydrolase